MSTCSLCMIVKDESAVIARCLQSVLPLIHAWTVVDTGSSDDTPKLVQSLLGHLPGQIQHKPWRNFAHNRTEAFQLNQGLADYHLVVDADDWLAYPKGYQLPELGADSYVLPVHYNGIRYRRPQLFRSDLDWRYEGVVHEYSHCPQAKTVGKLEAIAYVCSSGQGARSANPQKFLQDAALLEEALLNEPNHPRHQFYLAQSYRDAGLLEQAAEAYAQRSGMDGWSEEKYISHLERARLLRLLGGNVAEIRSNLLEAYQLNPDRAEAPTELARLHRERGQWHLAHLFAARAAQLKTPADGLFLEESVYAWRAMDELALASFYTDRFSEATQVTQKILQTQLPEVDQRRLHQNLQHCLAHRK